LKDREWISEKVLEILIYASAFWTAGDLAQTIYQWTYHPGPLDYQSSLLGVQPLVYYLIRGVIFSLLVQAASRKLTDSERARSGGQISWFEPWRIAQAVVLASLIISWAYWAVSQFASDDGKVAYQPAHPGVIAITGLAVLLSLGWPALFRLMEPQRGQDTAE